MGTRRRLAAGLCALSVALLFAGFGQTVATADTETDGSVSDTQGLGDQKGDDVGTIADTGTVNTIPELITTFDTESHPASDLGERHEESSGPTGPMDLGVSAHDETVGAAAVQADNAAVVQEDNKGSDSVAATAAEQVNEPEVVVSHSPVTEPSPEPEGTNAEAAAAPTNDPPAEAPTPVEPVPNVVASGDDPAASVQAEPAPLVGGAAQATDVITALTYFFISLADSGAQLISIPGDLLSLLGFTPVGTGVTVSLPAGGIGGSLMAGALHTAASLQLASSQAVQAGWPGMLIAPGDSAALSSAGVVHPMWAVGASGAVEQRSVGLKAVLADGIVPDSLRSFIQHTVDAVLAPLSLLALAALASPGVAGLWLLGAAGMFVGYRQARAASMLRAVGIARFVKAGPLGIVRSGGLVAVHARPSRAAGRQAAGARDLAESVA